MNVTSCNPPFHSKPTSGLLLPLDALLPRSTGTFHGIVARRHGLAQNNRIRAYGRDAKHARSGQANQNRDR